MSLHLGGKLVTGVYLGDKPVTKIYRGDQLVWSAEPPAPDYTAEVLADAPDLFVRLDSATPVDLSGNARTVTAYGTPTTTTDPTYGTVRATGAWITSATLGQAAFTLEAVAQIVPLPTTSAGLVSSWRLGAGAILGQITSGATNVWGRIRSSGDFNALQPVAVGWHHYCLSWDGATVALYVDGALAKATAYGTAPGGTAGIEIGTYQADSVLRWPGLIHSAASYSTALSADRIAAHAAAIL